MLRGFCVSGSVLCQAAGDTAWPGDEGGSTLVMCAYVLVILTELLNLCEGSQLERETVYYVSGGWEKLRKVRFCFSFRKQEGNRIYKVHLCEWHKACLKTSNQWPKKTKCSSCSPLCFLLHSTHSGHFIIQKVLWTLCHFCWMETQRLRLWAVVLCLNEWRLSESVLHQFTQRPVISVCGEGSCGVTKACMSLPDSSYLHSFTGFSILWLSLFSQFRNAFYSIIFYSILFYGLTRIVAVTFFLTF